MKLSQTSIDTKKNFPVVGIAASEGGLDACLKLIRAISKDSGMAYIILQHSPSDTDNLTEVLSHNTEIPVYEIVSKIDPIPNHIYVVPENNNLIIENNQLKLHTRTRGENKTETIDLFFESIAQLHKTFAVGVILSGSSFEGTFGLKKIKESGGITIAQEPATALFKAMPQSAINAHATDYIFAPEKIPGELILIQKSCAANHCYDEEELIPKNKQEILNQILNLVFLRTKNDFSHYKRNFILRKIARRMVMVRKESLEDYFNLLRNDKREQDMLFNNFLTPPPTYFFRDSAFFDSLAQTVFPRLTENTDSNDLRIWVAGCAGGEEAYSVAIAIHEYLTLKNNKDIKVQIFASDISEKCVTKARAGIYSVQDVKHISPSRLQTYFTKRDGNYHINTIIRDICVFFVHNFTEDSPFTQIDLVSCRNVLINFDSFLRNKVLNSFHHCLNEKGFIVLGKSEAISNVQDLFESLDEENKIYTHRHTENQYLFEETGAEPTLEINQTKKELNNAELQVINKELVYFKDELKDRHDQLISVRNYSESIFTIIQEPLLIVDRNFFIKSANPFFYTFFQTTEKETEGQFFFEIGNRQWDVAEFKEHILKMVRDNGNLEDYKVETTYKDIGKKTILINAQQLINVTPSGMILLTLKDITDLAVANEQLAAKNAELQKYAEQLETFSAAASNDLQEPLRKIHMFCKRIVDNEKNLSEASQHNLERVLFSATNMSQLIADLIDYSRINFVEKEFKKTDLNVILKKTISNIKNAILEKKAIITFFSFPQLNIIPYQIQQLFTNLILNSINYTREAITPEIKIETTQPSTDEIIEIGGNRNKKYLKICVRDNGIGFSQEYASKIFEPFYRLHNNDQYHGSGLGLTLVKKIVANHNGFIKISSKINQGTTVYIYLPL